MAEHEVKRMDVGFDVKAVDEKGMFEGYASVFNVLDKHEDRVMPGAFRESIEDWQSKGRMPPMLWSHDREEPIGPWLEMEEDDVGLRVKGQLLIDDITRARSVHALMRHKVIGGLSIGFIAREVRWDEKTMERDLIKVDLMEVSPVTFPSNTAAMVLAVKNLESKDGHLPSVTEFERALREAAFSKRQAECIIAKGYRQLLSEREGEPAEDYGVQSILDVLKEANELWTPQK